MNSWKAWGFPTKMTETKRKGRTYKVYEYDQRDF